MNDSLSERYAAVLVALGEFAEFADEEGYLALRIAVESARVEFTEAVELERAFRQGRARRGG